MSYCLWILSVLLAVSHEAAGAPGSPAECNASDQVPQRWSQQYEMPQGLRWGYSIFFLLNDPSVQAELQLTQKQQESLAALADDYLDSVRVFTKEIRSERKPDNVGAVWRAKIMANKNAELLARFGESGTALLTEGQRRRLDEVAFQLCAFDAVKYREVIDALKLSSEQIAEVRAIRDRGVRESRKSHEQLRAKQINREHFEQRLEEIVIGATERFRAILTQEQLQAMARMEGPRIHFGRRQLQMTIQKKSRASR